MSFLINIIIGISIAFVIWFFIKSFESFIQLRIVRKHLKLKERYSWHIEMGLIDTLDIIKDRKQYRLLNQQVDRLLRQ